MKRKSLKGIMLAYAFAVAVFTTLSIATYGYYQYASGRQHVLSSYDGLSAHLIAQVGATATGIQRTLMDVGYSSAVQNCVFTTRPEDFFSFNSSAQTILNLLCSRNDSIQGLYIVADNDRSLYNSNASIASFRKSWGYFQSPAKSASQSSGFTLAESAEGGMQLWYSAPIYNNMRTPYFNLGEKAFGAVLCDLGPLTRGLEASTGSDSCIAVLYQDVVVSANRTFSPTEQRVLSRIQNGVSTLSEDGAAYLAKAVPMSMQDWRLVFFTPQSGIVRQAARLGTGSIVVLLLFAFITALFILTAFLMTVRPVSRILGDIRRMRESRWCSRISDSRVSEFSEIVNGINETLDRMQEAHRHDAETQDRLYQAIIAQNRARLSAYRMQINPHFLFNTLECMRSMASIYAADPVEDMIESLSFMFRHAFQVGEFATMGEEVRHLEHYVNVMNMRFPDRYELRVRIDEPLLQNWSICSMILQPLAENSIRHGFRNRTTPGRIVLRCERLDTDSIRIRFADNGAGISAERMEKVRQTLSLPEDMLSEPADHGVALTNIHHRLRLSDRCAEGLSIESREGIFTTISFVWRSHVQGNAR